MKEIHLVFATLIISMNIVLTQTVGIVAELIGEPKIFLLDGDDLYFTEQNTNK